MAIVALTPAGHVLLVEQYRIPVGGPVIELPAGLVGDEPQAGDETLEEAAQRELVEETGYRAGSLTLLTDGVSSAGLTDERIFLLRAWQLQRVGPGGGTGHESIQVHEVPIGQVDDWLEQQREQGRAIDFKVFAGLYFLRRDSA